MKMRKSNVSDQPFRKSVAFMLVFYWAILVAWQNISGTETRGAADIVVKAGLLLYFCWFYVKRARVVNGKICWVLLIAIFLLITSISEISFSLKNLIFYVYPVLFMAMVYGLGDSYEITRVQLISFCNWVIAITMYAAVYAFIFQREMFIGVLSLTGAYSNELTSFFLSNFEYGMYLASAIISCLICLKYGDSISSKRFYYVAIAIFAVQLALTFSRSTLYALIICLIVIALVGKGKTRYWIIGLSTLTVLAVLSIPELKQFVYRVVMKGNNLSDRGELALGAIDLYRSGSVAQKIFGFGIEETQRYFALMFRHPNVHNAYLQVLLYFGLAGFLPLMLFLVIQIIICIKILRRNRYLGSIFLGQLLMVIAIMFTTTAIIFTSSIDSYFLTMFYIVVPKYVRNSLRKHTFD